MVLAGIRLGGPIGSHIRVTVQILFGGKKGSQRWTRCNRPIVIRQIIRDIPRPSTITERAPFTETANLGGGLAHALAAACPFCIRHPRNGRRNPACDSSLFLRYEAGMVAGDVHVRGMQRCLPRNSQFLLGHLTPQRTKKLDIACMFFCDIPRVLLHLLLVCLA